MYGVRNTDQRIEDLKDRLAEYQLKSKQLEAERERLSRRIHEIIDELESIDQKMMQVFQELSALLSHE